jgi:hypothetical protein
MIQRSSIYLWLFFLFAFMQIGGTMHSVSHWVECHTAQHEDQDRTESECAQCLSFNHANDVDLSSVDDITITANRYNFVEYALVCIFTARAFAYIARAPPYDSQV